MRIVVCLDGARLFRWHLTLITALARAGHDVAAEFRADPHPLPVTLLAILDFDAVRAGAAEERLSDRLTRSLVSENLATAAGDTDLTIDLSTSTAIARHPARTLTPLYDGSATDEVLFHALLAGSSPQLTVADTRDNGVWTIGLPALEQPTRFARSLDNVSSRLVEGLLAIVDRIAAGKTAPATGPAARARVPQSSMLRSAAIFSSHRLRSKASRIAERAFGSEHRWHVAWRRVAADTLRVAETLELSNFRVLEDDGRRYFADPFVVMHDGAVHVFVEELPEETGVGIISHFVIAPDGIATKPAPVLDTGSHLSYPQVFEQDGETWMLPESSAAGGLDLYRCRRFPDEWDIEARLIEGRLHDATLFSHEGRLWIAAATEAYQSSSWDALSLFHAETLLGPWTPHALNPVLVDASAARPAGPLWRDRCDLLRPAQNCRIGYGSRLTVRKILRLTPDEFAEETVGTIAFAGSQPMLGPHTLGRSGDLEIIDLYASDREIGGAR